MQKLLPLLALASLSALSKAASPVELFADVNWEADHYRYAFTLKLTNADKSWTLGDAWGWIVFADSKTLNPLTTFVGDSASLTGGPWSGFSVTQGGHNGPTLDLAYETWTPKFVGDTVHWIGTATEAPTAGVAWSSLFTLGNAKEISYLPIILSGNYTETKPTPAPEPITLATLGFGLILGLRRQGRRA